jgi:catechol 2,3-dioxygenase-like lactoylglutathione lyase family enzyme
MPLDHNPWAGRLTHLGIVVRDIEKAIAMYRDTFGAGPFKRFSLPSDDFITFRWRHHFGIPADDHRYEVAYGNMGAIGVELFQCIAGDSIPQRFLDARGEGVWHYGYDVDDIEATTAWMSAHGFPVIGGSEHSDGTRMLYFDTFAATGVYWQAHEVHSHSTLRSDLGQSPLKLETAGGENG